ncbi:hypothetical protein MPSEU_001009700 [Mayamaea pseudoterrestris]|nr:hypothetical protein MPSEU_001009700 [Mayamaea pseudoterrestris]
MRFTIPKNLVDAFPLSSTKLRAYRPKGGKLGFGLCIVWTVAGIAAIAIPRIKWSSNANTYYNTYGRDIQYENEQRQYERQQDKGDDDANNEYNYLPNCSWYQWKCRKQMYYYFQNNGNQDENAVILPTWYKFLGGQSAGGEEMRRYQEENGLTSADDTPAAVSFVHGYTMFVFIAVLLYGGYVFLNGEAYSGLVVSMAVLSQFLLMIIVLLPQGVIQSDDRDIENSIYGWYGQTAVLMVYQDFAYILFCLSFIGVLAIIKLIIWRRAKKNGTLDEQFATKQVDGHAANDGSYHAGNYYKAEDTYVVPAQRSELV